MNQPNTPNIGELLTPEDEVLVKKAIQSNKPAVHSPFEGKSLYLQFTKSLSNRNDGLAAWKSFLGKISTKSGEMVVQRPARNTQLSSKPKQSMVSDDTQSGISRSSRGSSNLSDPGSEYGVSEVTDDRLSDKLSPETSAANNIPYGIPRSVEDIEEEKPILKPLKRPEPKPLPSIPRRSEELLSTEREDLKTPPKSVEILKEKLANKSKKEDKVYDVPSLMEIGDPDGEYYKVMLRRALNKFGGDTHKANDLVQEVLFQLSQKATKENGYKDYGFRGEAPFENWISSRLSKRTIDQFRKEGAKKRDKSRNQSMTVESEGEDISIDPVDRITAPADIDMERDEVKQAIFDAIGKLDPLEQAIMLYKHYGYLYDPEKNKKIMKDADKRRQAGKEPKKFELSNKKIAEELGITEQTVKNKYLKGSEELALVLGKLFANSVLDSHSKPLAE